MVDLTKVTKEDATQACIELLGIIAGWTDCFFDDKAGGRLLKLNEADYVPWDVDSEPKDQLKNYIARSNLHESVFVKRLNKFLNLQSGAFVQKTKSVNSY